MDNKSKPFIDNQAAATFLEHYTKNVSKSFYDQRRSQLKNICFFLYVLVPFFQTPFWVTSRDELDDAKYYLTMKKEYYLTRETYNIISLVLIVCIILGLIFKPQYSEGKKRNFHRWLVLPIMILSFLEIFVLAIFYEWKPYFSTFMTPIAFLLNSSYLRTLTFRSARLITAARRMLFYLAVVILFFAWVGRIAFNGDSATTSNIMDTDDSGESWTQRPPFGSLGDSVFTLVTLLTGARFPQVMNADFATDKRVIFYYLSYLILGVYFILGLLLAVFYQAYKRIKGEMRQEKKQENYASIEKSWKQLVGFDDGLIDRKTALKFFRSTRRNKSKANILKIKKMPLVENDERIFDLLDKESKKALEKSDYIKFCNMISLVNDLPEKDANIIYKSENTYFRVISSWATSTTFESFMLFVCFANLIVLAVAEEQDSFPENWWVYMQLALTILYFLEITIMILAGADKFLGSANNIIELFLTTYSLFLLLGNYYRSEDPNTTDSEAALKENLHFVQYAILIRMFRFFQIALRSPEWRLIYRCIQMLIPVIITFFLSIIALYYLFALIGVCLFGGSIYAEHPAYPADDPFWTQSQWNSGIKLAYNDFPGALITLFVFLFHPWNVSSAIAMTVGGQYSIWFFIVFYFLCVLMAVNIILPIVILTFMNEFKRSQELSTAKAFAESHGQVPVNFVGKNNPYTAVELDVLVKYQINGKEGLAV